MTPVRGFQLAVPIALLVVAAACGGTSADPSFANASPSFSSMSMDMTGADTAPPSSYVIAPTTQQMLMPSGTTCNPHLFYRTHEVVARVNRHIYKYLNHVEALIAKDPTSATGTQVVWEQVRSGVDVKFTITKAGPETFTWKLEMEPQGATSFTTVFTGQIDRTNATAPHQGTGSLTLDLTALHAVLPTEPVAGTVNATFDLSATSRKLVVDAANVSWDVRLTDFDSDDSTEMSAAMTNVLSLLETPRNAHYVYTREPGKGGSLKISDQMLFVCPIPATAADYALANVDLVERWYRASDGAVHGRSDAMMSGGQLPSLATQVSRVVGVTCHQSDSETSVTTAESFWLMKAEGPAPTYATVAGMDFDSSSGGVTASACDPLLNETGQPTTSVISPTLADASTDFDFAQITFSDDQPYPFPNM